MTTIVIIFNDDHDCKDGDIVNDYGSNGDLDTYDYKIE